MTTMTSGIDCPSTLAATRDGLHRVAEHVLAAALYQATGKIGLVPGTGRRRTLAPALRRWHDLGTATEAAAFFRDGRARAQAATLTEARRTP